MENSQNEEIEKLKSLLLDLEAKNSSMFHELKDVKEKLNLLVSKQISQAQTEKPVTPIVPVVESPKIEAVIPPPVQQKPTVVPAQNQTSARPPVKKQAKTNQDWERFIGENLISKIGILITIIGVGIGAKYAIDHELISPQMRIILGYLVGLGLMIFAMKLKAKYLDFSAVLLSGSMTIFYFLTYISFSFYHYFPVGLTFFLMVLFTGFTVFSSVQYNRPIIAHLGLVGAYAVPFLLSNGSGRVGIFFSYIAFVNIGILVLSFIKNWKSLLYVAFGFTWLIFFTWYAFSYRAHLHFEFAISFVFIFFLIFYVTGLAYKVLKHEKFEFSDVLLILLNSFAFFGFGYNIIANRGGLDDYLGLFCVFNAVLHFIVSVYLFRNKLVDKTIFFLTAAMVLFFITITIPVQLDGNAITITWSFEALMLFLLGRLKKIPLFESMSYPIICLGFFSLLFFWTKDYGFMSFFYYHSKEALETKFLLNERFLTSFCFVLVGTIMYVFNTSNRFKFSFEEYKINKSYFLTFKTISIIFLIIASYFAFFLEINAYWSNCMLLLRKNIDNFYSVNDAITSFSSLSKIAFSLLFVGMILFMRKKQTNGGEFNVFAFVIGSLVIFVFLTIGLYDLSSLQLRYLYSESELYNGISLVVIRYVLFALVTFYLVNFMHFLRNQFNGRATLVFTEYMLHLVIVWVLSAELVNWMHVFNSRQVYKLGLSIFWGIYSLGLVSLGIWMKKSFLRFGAFSLFGITLIKLFFYDIAHMTTLTKTIVFIALGILLLIISFLYNKYKSTLFDDAEK